MARQQAATQVLRRQNKGGTARIAGTDPPLTRGEQLRHRPPHRFGRVLRPVHDVEDVAAVTGVRVLEVAALGHAEVAHDLGRVLTAGALDLLE